MADDALRQFYSCVGQLLGPIDNWRRANAAKHDALSATAAGIVLSMLSSWEPLFEAMATFKKQQNEWDMAYGVWKHGGKFGEEPVRPKWPTGIPEFDAALGCVKALERLRELTKVSQDDRLTNLDIELPHGLQMLIIHLNNLQISFKDEPKGHVDGPIDRNRLAELIGIQPKTLANRADEMPEPIGRDSKSVPIYQYSDAKAALAKMYPSKEFMLPEYQDAKRQSV